ncbi:AfsR/SARP family transcriptional regulator [Methylobacterium frigidaeris]|jgi:DNA-binding SARP family transcriptional activator|uniref:Transcriptional regulatory protein MoaR1 n=1 Tax=Methylobacterium frigidaeris TaxID=2038277 RepID=A0AA37HE34_9HYPH|nr:BTAD domain-containing putative transcriptional regulator [Methylobacterium frigidaeris]GJD64332.1 Transcriptional regulatory protein MoaR1 [Methylobacterium frigidaeris]
MLQVRLLGCFALEQSQRDQSGVLGRNGRRLAAYLFAYPNRSHRRDRLIDLFWTESAPDQGRTAFSTALWKIKRTIGASGRQMALHAVGPNVVLEIAKPAIVDAHRFATDIEVALSASCADSIRPAIELYGGAFLEEFDGDWVLEERERLEVLYVRALTLMMRQAANQSRYEDALSCARRILATDPMRESAQRATMLLYTLNGQRGQAIRQFERCRATLREECGVDPMPETRSLDLMIRSGAVFERIPALLSETFGTRG